MKINVGSVDSGEPIFSRASKFLKSQIAILSRLALVFQNGEKSQKRFPVWSERENDPLTGAKEIQAQKVKLSAQGPSQKPRASRSKIVKND